MKSSYILLLSSFLLITLIGSVSANFCPGIPPPPYIPKSPQEDIIKIETYIDPSVTSTITSTRITKVANSLRSIAAASSLHLTVTFAEATPPADQAILILVTMLMGTPPKEEVLDCAVITGSSSITHVLEFPILLNGEAPSIAVYAALVNLTTDRAPNDDFYQITSLSSTDPNVFQDSEAAPVGGVTTPTNRLEIMAPYLVLAGLIAAVSFVIIKKRK